MPLTQFGTDKLMIKKHIRLKNQKTRNIKCLKRKGDKTEKLGGLVLQTGRGGNNEIDVDFHYYV